MKISEILSYTREDLRKMSLTELKTVARESRRFAVRRKTSIEKAVGKSPATKNYTPGTTAGKNANRLINTITDAQLFLNPANKTNTVRGARKFQREMIERISPGWKERRLKAEGMKRGKERTKAIEKYKKEFAKYTEENAENIRDFWDLYSELEGYVDLHSAKTSEEAQRLLKEVFTGNAELTLPDLVEKMKELASENLQAQLETIEWSRAEGNDGMQLVDFGWL